ncbi:NACHT domain-containing NTPase [Streptomyces sp. FH025]|uniref:NACHT domain-containing protein n=1 Tax=Streptomyces sp. FH025 TaxID=2815937 RepID=UPI001A9ED99A|nr:NACHT domain-containing protein [Streptomyces sp. FH025]MBO1418944.1 NACHT domain-containing protein [Streptomyces sp. FH025]
MTDEVQNSVSNSTVGGDLIQASTVNFYAASPVEPAEHAALAELAGEVGAQWGAEAKLIGVEESTGIAVEWAADWAPAQPAGGRRELVGASEVVAKVRDSLSYRLVITGPAGAGKSALAVQLLLGLLKDRKPAQPVPVLFLLSEWNPAKKRLDRWLTQRIVEDYGRPGSKLDERTVGKLLGRGLIVPVLDGLDELAPSKQLKALKALRKACGQTAPLVLTSRPEEYEKAARDRVLRAMPVLRARPVSTGAAESYLRRSCHPDRLAAWQPVFDELERNPGGTIATVLSSPLMLWLAQVGYEDGKSDPGDLLDPERPARKDVEGHLLDQFLRVKFDGEPPSPFDPRLVGRWDHRSAVGYLRFLARQLNRDRSRNLAWWRLRSPLTAPAVWGLVVVTAAALAGAAAGQVLALLLWAVGRADYEQAASAASIIGSTSILTAVAGGFLAAYFFGGFDGRPRKPAGRRAHVLLVLLVAMVGGLAATTRVNLSAVLAVVLPSLAGVVLSTPVESGAMAVPKTLLAGERRTARAKAFLVAPAIAGSVVFGIGTGGSDAVVVVGALLDGWLCAAVVLAGLSGWWRWNATWWFLARRGKLPRRTLEFLEDAHKLGVLRKISGIYQFRHAELQQRLDDSWPDETHPSFGTRPEVRLRSSRESFRMLVDFGLTPALVVFAFLLLVWPLSAGVEYWSDWQESWVLLSPALLPVGAGAATVLLSLWLAATNLRIDAEVIEVNRGRKLRMSWDDVEEVRIVELEMAKKTRAVVPGMPTVYCLAVKPASGRAGPKSRTDSEGWVRVWDLGTMGEVPYELEVALSRFAGDRWYPEVPDPELPNPEVPDPDAG